MEDLEDTKFKQILKGKTKVVVPWMYTCVPIYREIQEVMTMKIRIVVNLGEREEVVIGMAHVEGLVG